MFTLFRAVIIIGLIVYFSPVRNPGAPEGEAQRSSGAVTSAPSPLKGEAVAAEESVWSRMRSSFAEEVVRTALSDKAQDVGLRLKDQVPWPPSSGTDLVRSSERNSAAQGVRCVYRCDGTE